MALGNPTAIYAYVDERDSLLFEVCRYENPKTFRVRRPDGHGGYVYNLDGVSPEIYRRPAVSEAIKAGITLYIVEGEKDADRLTTLGLTATCNPGGAGKWRNEYCASFAGAEVVVLPDNDGPGRAHAEQVATFLVGVAKSVRLLELPGLPDKGDVSDWLDARGNRAALERLAAQTPEWKPKNKTRARDNGGLPTLHGDAMHGLAGEVVIAIEPHSESDPAALLLDFLTSFGNAVGDGPHMLAESSQHPGRLFPVVVGATSRARKGSSRANVRRTMEAADSDWADNRIIGGLASGEGLIESIRSDEVAGISDPDKRWLVHEPEFARILKVAGREGNILSMVIRTLFDEGRAENRRASNSRVVKDAHVSIIAHITVEELRRAMTETDMMNGFANRFLYVFAQRSKRLPHGGNLSERTIQQLGDRIRERLRAAQGFGRMKRTPEADQLWEEIYNSIDDDVYGMYGAVVARAEAQMLRLSVIYALLDGTKEIDVVHVKAARAVWDYCDATARLIFGETMGDPVGDTILASVHDAHPNGLSETDLHGLFARHVSRDRLQVSIKTLEGRGLIYRETQQTQGRPRTVYHCRCEESEVSEERVRFDP